MRRSVRIGTLLLCALFLSGCAGKLPGQSTLTVSKGGAVTRVYVEEFARDFYDEAELAGEIKEELADYNKNFGSDHVKLKKFTVKDGVAALKLHFDEAKYYADYTDSVFFVGTISEAEAAGYDLSGECMDPEGSLTDVKTAVGTDHVKVLVLEEYTAVELPGSIVCVSREGNVEITEKRCAEVKEEGKTAFIIYQ